VSLVRTGRRKRTGSYYTPDYIVQYIVEHAVGPVLDEKFAALTPKLRDAQKALKQERDKAAALSKHGTKHDDPEHEAYLKHRRVVDDLFDVKVLDPAMGSGAFLVEACRQLGDHRQRPLSDGEVPSYPGACQSSCPGDRGALLHRDCLAPLCHGLEPSGL